MSIILNGTTGITTPDLTSAAGLDAADLTGTVASARLPAGSVLQVVSATKTDSYSMIGTGFADVPGLSVSITPTSSSSKILIISSISGQGGVNVSFLATRLVRNSTEISVGDSAASGAAQATSSSGYTTDAGGLLHLSMMHLDSPSTTSSTTYKVQASSLHSGGAAYINRSQQDNSYTRARTTSSITVMEIAG
jgi:hypothetical protein